MRSAKHFGEMVRKAIDEDPELLEITEQVEAATAADRNARSEVAKLDQKIKVELDADELGALIEAQRVAQTLFERREQTLIRLMKREKELRIRVRDERALPVLYGEENEIRSRIGPALKQLEGDLREVRNIGNTLRKYRIPWDGPSTLDVKRAIQTLRRV